MPQPRAETDGVSSSAPRVPPPGVDVVLYDGVCALCNASVRFLLARDPVRRFRFAPLQSDFAHQLLARHGRDPAGLDTLYLVEGYGRDDERVLEKSRAVLQLARLLGPPWSAARIFAILPTALLDFKYDLLASVRYRLFGRYDTCPLPKPEHRDLFLERK